MGKRIIADATASVLVWARTTLGLSVEDAAKKLGVKVEQLEAWEAEESSPTVPQLRKAAGVYKRPIALFFLPKPPKDTRPPKDFRRLPDNLQAPLSPGLRLEIRKAELRQSIAEELLDPDDWKPLASIGTGSLSEDVGKLAERVRSELEVELAEQVSWTDPYEALSGWTRAFERHSILVFQASGVAVNEMRGISFPSDTIPAILLNARDAPRGRIFTLMHELGHLVLGRVGMCDLHEDQDDRSSVGRVEQFCNAFASALLVPAGALLGHPVVRTRAGLSQWTDDELVELSRYFCVSTEAVLRRLVAVSRASMSFYLAKRTQFLAAAKEYERSMRLQSGGPSPFRRVLAANGRLFTRLVLDGYHDQVLTGSDVSEYLMTKLSHLPKIEDALSYPSGRWESRA